MVQYKDKTVALASGAGKGIGLSNHEGSRSARRHRARRVAQPRAWGDGREGPGKMKKYGARVSVLRTPSPVHKKPPACNLNALSQACLRRSWSRCEAGRSLAAKRTRRRELPPVVNPVRAPLTPSRVHKLFRIS